jgi:hypothetical protein
MELIALYVNCNSHLLITHGVSQGSILEPLLFLVYVNDLPLNIQYEKLVIYADDTNKCPLIMTKKIYKPNYLQL